MREKILMCVFSSQALIMHYFRLHYEKEDGRRRNKIVIPYKNYLILYSDWIQMIFSNVKNKIRKIWIRCTSWFNAGSRIIENNFRDCFFLFLAPRRAITLWGPILITFLTLRGKANISLT